MKRLILVSATPNRFYQQHNIPLGHWVLTDPQLSRVFASCSGLVVRKVVSVKQGAMRCDNNGNESCFLTNSDDPLFREILREAQRTYSGGNLRDIYGPVFNLKTDYGIIRWFVSTASARRVIGNVGLPAETSFTLRSSKITSLTSGWTYWVPKIA